MDVKEVLKEILKSPGLAAFSRIRFVGTLMTEEEQVRFLKALYSAAVEARESGSIDALADLLEEWEAKGLALAGARAQAPQVKEIPWASLRVPLRQAKLAIVTTGGFYVEGQKPYETDGPEGLGDWSYRVIPKTVPRDQLRVAHLHYDLSGPRQDINCVFPLDRFVELEQEGIIGRLADINYSFMGYIPKPEHLMNETAPEVARLLKADGVDAVLLTTTWTACNRSGGLVARAIEEVGIPTVVAMMYKEMAEKVKPPRVAHVRFPFGRPLGEPNNPDQHRVIIEDALGILETATQPGTVVTLPYRWRREDYADIRRERAAKNTIERLVADSPSGKGPHEIEVR